VPHKAAFSGFGDDIVIIVASALVVSAAIERSGVIEALLHRMAPSVTSVQGQVVILVTTVSLLSVFIKNIGALAMMIPVAFQTARRSKASPSSFLMPMAFGSLLGGLTTLVGTSPNIVVSRMREELTGRPFNMFDFTPVGIGLATAGVVLKQAGCQLLPLQSKLRVQDGGRSRRQASTGMVANFGDESPPRTVSGQRWPWPVCIRGCQM
jgi:di/tricarboxylate transporter